jgi:hypothetical protein
MHSFKQARRAFDLPGATLIGHRLAKGRGDLDNNLAATRNQENRVRPSLRAHVMSSIFPQ